LWKDDAHREAQPCTSGDLLHLHPLHSSVFVLLLDLPPVLTLPWGEEEATTASCYLGAWLWPSLLPTGWSLTTPCATSWTIFLEGNADFRLL
jgi:hypothetical protein